MNIARTLQEWRLYRQTRDELYRLSGRELEDIGLTRGDIPFAARKAARK